MDTEYITDLIKDLETADEVVVVFVTKRGDRRIMRCTLNPDNIPAELLGAGEEKQIDKEFVIGVYDYDNSAWRAFRKDSIICHNVVDWQ